MKTVNIFVLMGFVFILMLSYGCSIKKGEKTAKSMQTIQDLYLSQRDIYVAEKNIVNKILAGNKLNPEEISKLKKADKLIIQADNKIREVWENEVIQKTLDVNRIIQISKESIELLKIAKGLLGGLK